MGYGNPDIDQLTTGQLWEEINRRFHNQTTNTCSYCGHNLSEHTCKYATDPEAYLAMYGGGHAAITPPPSPEHPTPLRLHWCDVDGWSKADCACSVGWREFATWEDAEKDDKERRAEARAQRHIPTPTMINTVVKFPGPHGTSWLITSEHNGIQYGRGLGIVFPSALSDARGGMEPVDEAALDEDDQRRLVILRANPGRTFDQYRELFDV